MSNHSQNKTIAKIAIVMNALLLASLIGYALLASGCGASVRQKAVSGAFTTLNVVRDEFFAYDLKRQEQIFDQSSNRAAYDANMASYRKRQAHMIQLLSAAYQAIAAAAVLQDDQSIAAMFKAGLLVQESLKTFKAGGDL